MSRERMIKRSRAGRPSRRLRILAAAMCSYFAAELREKGLPGANRIELLVSTSLGDEG